MGELVIGAGVSDDPPGRPSLRVDRERWAEARLLGVMPPATLDRDEQLRQLLVRLQEGNRPSVGRLCDETRPGLDTYRRVSAGECFIWCTGYSRIIRDFLRSAGVPSRLIDLSPQVVTLDGGVTVQSSEAHQTTEQWDRDRWVWIDGTMGVLRALDPDGNALSTRQVVAALGSTPTRDALRFVRLDPAYGGWSVRSYQDQDDPFRLTLAATLTPDKIMAIPNGGFG
jgi:hypothetical protein